MSEPSEPPPPRRQLPDRADFPLRDSELPTIASAPVAPATKRGRRIALAILLLIAFVAVAWMAAPLSVGLVLGTVMAFTAQPLYRKLAAFFGDRRSFAAAMTTIIGGVVTAAGGAAVLYIIGNELSVLSSWLTENLPPEVQPVADGSPEHAAQLAAQAVRAEAALKHMIGEPGVEFAKTLGLNPVDVVAKIREGLDAASKHATEVAGTVVSTTTSALLSLVIAAFTMYYVLIEWPRLAVRLEHLLPLDPRHTRALMLEFRDVGRSAFIGTIATAVVQGLLAGIGFAIAQVPQPVTWGVVTAIASFLPVVGTSLVWVPMGGYLVMQGHVWWAVFVWAWGALIVMAVSDYVIRPRLVGSKGHGHPLLMLIALLGGIEVFGLAGLIAGPVLMSLFLAIVRIYERDALSDPPAAAAPENRAGE